MAGDARVRFLDRLLKTVRPAAIDSFTPEPQAVGEGIWVVERQLSIPPALRLCTHMTLVRLPGGRLVVHSPVRLDPALLQTVRALGEVAAIVAPNSFHYAYAVEWMTHFPAAVFHCAPGLNARVAGLPRGIELADDAPELWRGELDQIVYGPMGPFCEVAFCHRPSKTLILCDLAFNMTRFDSAFHELGWRAMGVPQHFGPSRSARLTLLRDRDAARPYLQRIAAWDFDRIVVAHGDVVPRNGKAVFTRGFESFLP